MKELKDFNTEKSIYIGKVLNHIHYKKLHTRIYEEISNHMDDMYEDFSAGCDDEKEVTKKVLEEMGHPHYLGLELKKANKSVLLRAKIFKITCAVLTLPIIYLSIVAVSIVGSEISHYFNAHDIEEKEEIMMEDYNGGEPIKLFAEIEHNGFVYRFYIPEKPKDYFTFYYTQSIKVFNISIKDKFGVRGGGGREYPETDSPRLFVLDSPDWHGDILHIYCAPSTPKYMKVYYEPTDASSGLEPYWSDFFEIPQNATYDNPQYIIIDSPDGYNYSNYEEFNENKEPIDKPFNDQYKKPTNSVGGTTHAVM